MESKKGNAGKKRKEAKKGGGKLNRSEILQARLNLKSRLAAEIIARHQKRTLSNLIEVLIEREIERYKIPVVHTPSGQVNVRLFHKIKSKSFTVKEAMERIWSEEEADRFAALALFLPELLLPEEARVWELIVSTPYFWEHFEINIETKSGKVLDTEPWAITHHRSLIKEHLREHWSLLKSILEGRASPEKFKQLKLPVGRLIKKPEDYPFPIKKVDTSRHD